MKPQVRATRSAGFHGHEAERVDGSTGMFMNVETNLNGRANLNTGGVGRVFKA